MTPDEMSAYLAEAMGWKKQPDHDGSPNMMWTQKAKNGVWVGKYMVRGEHEGDYDHYYWDITRWDHIGIVIDWMKKVKGLRIWIEPEQETHMGGKDGTTVQFYGGVGPLRGVWIADDEGIPLREHIAQAVVYALGGEA